jgi:DNA invertase Pin-like site-specific DNA recombinase
MVRIGYARVSRLEQEMALQLYALCAAGCDRILRIAHPEQRRTALG